MDRTLLGVTVRHLGTAGLGAAVLAVGMVACAARGDLMRTHLAQVAIDGNDMKTFPGSYAQVRWQWTIETLERSPGFVAILDTE